MCTVAIGNPKQHVHKASHCGRSNNEIMLEISLTIASSRFIYNGFIPHAHPPRGESHNQRNTTGEVATITMNSNDRRFMRRLHLALPSYFGHSTTLLVYIALQIHKFSHWIWITLTCGRRLHPGLRLLDCDTKQAARLEVSEVTLHNLLPSILSAKLQL